MENQNNQLQIFKNEELKLKVRTIQNEDGSISISAEDTAIGFGFTTVAKSGNVCVRWNRVNGYCKEFGFDNRLSKNDFIPESLFYMLGMKASNNKAKKFQQWLAVDVIPSIRKHGAYMTDEKIEEVLTNPDTIIKLATQLKEERQARKLAENKVYKQEKVIENMQPQAIIGDSFTNDSNLFDMAKFCKLLDIKGLGRNNMFKYLRDNEILRYNNEPYQKYTNYFKMIVFKNRFTGENTTKTLVKSKGINFIVKRLIKDGYIITKSVDEILNELESYEV